MKTYVRRQMLLLAVVAVLAVATPALAGRGGFGGGRGGGGGGRGFSGGGGARGFSGGNFGGARMGGYSGGSFNRGGFNAPNRNYQPQNFNRNNLSNNNFNRNNFNNTNINRNNFNSTNINRNNFNNVGINGNNFRGYGNNWAGRYGYGNYNHNWVHGYWNGNYGGWGYRPYGYGNGWGNNASWFGLGALSGWGLSNWSYGSSLYNWGYMPYSDPYYFPQAAGFVQQPATAYSQYDYSQPINTQTPPPDQTTTDGSLTTFEKARAAFMSGDYNGALTLSNQAIAKLPSDTSLHEFNALCLFALGQYDASASALYAVLSVGPGWDWTTLVGLYPDVETYTAQLRKLEAYCRDNPKSAPARFVLGYHYLTQGFTENAQKEFTAASQIQPSDKLSAQLAAQLAKPAAEAAETQPATPQPASPVPAGASLAGSWTATPAAGTTISLTIGADNAFSWSAKNPSQAQPTKIAGDSTYADGVLTLAQKQGQPLVGRVVWKDATHMNFQVVGAAAGDPGLSFVKN